MMQSSQNSNAPNLRAYPGKGWQRYRPGRLKFKNHAHVRAPGEFSVQPGAALYLFVDCKFLRRVPQTPHFQILTIQFEFSNTTIENEDITEFYTAFDGVQLAYFHYFCHMDALVTIRQATAHDAQGIFQLIKELAEYERAPHEVINSPEAIIRDGFGENPVFWCLVAEQNREIVGMSLWYIRYSTWKGKTLYLEDIVVRQALRGQKIGEKLFKATVQAAKDGGFNSMNWQVLDWNEPAIRFYKKYNAEFSDEWLNVRLLPHQFDTIITQ